MSADMKKQKKQKIVLAVLLIGGILFALYENVLMPRFNMMRDLRQTVRVQREDLDRILIETDNIDLPQRRIIQGDDLEEKENIKKLPFVMDTIGLFREFNYLFIINDLQSNRLSFGSPSHTSTYSHFTINFDVRGTKDDIERFIEQMENMENFTRLSSIEQMSLRLAGEDEASLSLTLRVYFYTEGKSVREPSDYDFMESRYGIYDNFFDILQNTDR